MGCTFDFREKNMFFWNNLLYNNQAWLDFIGKRFGGSLGRLLWTLDKLFAAEHPWAILFLIQTILHDIWTFDTIYHTLFAIFCKLNFDQEYWLKQGQYK